MPRFVFKRSLPEEGNKKTKRIKTLPSEVVELIPIVCTDLERYRLTHKLKVKLKEGLYLCVNPDQIVFVVADKRSVLSLYLMPKIYKWMALVHNHQKYKKLYIDLDMGNQHANEAQLFEFFAGDESYPGRIRCKRKGKCEFLLLDFNEKYFIDWSLFQDPKRGDFTSFEEQINATVLFKYFEDIMLKKYLALWKQKTYRYGSKVYQQLEERNILLGMNGIRDAEEIEAFWEHELSMREKRETYDNLKYMFGQMFKFKRRVEHQRKSSIGIRRYFVGKKIWWSTLGNINRMADLADQIAAVTERRVDYATCITEYGFTKIYPYNFFDLLSQFNMSDVDKMQFEKCDPWRPFKIHVFRFKNKYIFLDKILNECIELYDVVSD